MGEDDTKTINILSIDAWAAGDGEWQWNTWHKVGTCPLATCDLPHAEIIAFMIEEGYLKPGAADLAEVYDDQYNMVIQDKETGEPLFALEYGPAVAVVQQLGELARMPRKQRAPRKLTLSDVEISIQVEPEQDQVRGNFASGDEDADRALEDEIIALADAGYVEAWCCIVVKARWKGFEGVDSLGCCSHLIRDDLPSLDKQVEDTIEAHGMREQALDDLNREIAEAHAKLASLTEAS